jgi:hypothetical protein
VTVGLSLSVGRLTALSCQTATVGSEVERELDDRWWFGIRGSAVEAIEVAEFSVGIKFGGSAALTIESAAALGDSSAPRGTTAISINSDGTISASERLMSLVGRRVVSGIGFKTGDLRLVFEPGDFLTVPAGDAYEAWQLTGPSGRLWVSLPGGGLACFPPAEEPT